jgi:MiaB-like tRNA modifying enzyme
MNIIIETYGCTANHNDSEIVAGILRRKGFNVVFCDALKNSGDLAIINTCVVKEPTLKKMERRIYELLKRYRLLVVTGCMANVYREKILEIKEKVEKENGKRFLLILPNYGIKNVDKVVRDLIKKEKGLNIVEREKEEKVNLDKIRINRVIGISQIAYGCSSYCSFCITKLAKGALKSYSKRKIIENVKKDLNDGCKEIWLTATDLACYGLDKGKYMLVDLVKDIVKIRKNFWLRLGMMNPQHVKNFYKDLFGVYESEKLFKFLHLPLQSGSNNVLREMNRQYTVEQFLKIAKEFRRKFKQATLATDIIVGFYNEKEKDFKKTIEVIKEIKPEITNISRFWPMPKTLAYKKVKEADLFDEVRAKAKERAEKLFELTKKISLEKNRRFIGEKVLCLVDKKGYENTYLARDINYKLIAIKDKAILGKFYKVEIIDAKSNFLIGKIEKIKKDNP